MPDHQLVYDRLVDDESRIYFDARKSHLTDPSLTRFYSIIEKRGFLTDSGSCRSRDAVASFFGVRRMTGSLTTPFCCRMPVTV